MIRESRYPFLHLTAFIVCGLLFGRGDAFAVSVVDIPAAKTPTPGAKPLPTRQSLIGGTAKKFVLTVDDVKVMEPVCILILGYEGDGGGFWYPRLSKDPILTKPEYVIARGAQSFHHYCWAEIARYRYYRAKDKATRDDMAEAMVADLQFVLTKRSLLPPNWPYLPKIIVALGEGQLMAGRNAEAVQSFARAIEQDKKYAPAYHALADFWIKAGDKAKALDTVTEGLKHQPDNAGLRKRYKELGGKAPLPPPSSTKGSGKAQEGGGSGKEGAPAQGTTPKKTAAPVDTAPKPVRAKPVPEAEDLKRQANPYCRFCPW